MAFGEPSAFVGGFVLLQNGSEETEDWENNTHIQMGDRSAHKNYTPVAPTSHCIKFFEKIVVRKLGEYMERHELFSNCQQGFGRSRSWLSQLLAEYHSMLEALERGLEVDVVQLDCLEAFD